MLKSLMDEYMVYASNSRMVYSLKLFLYSCQYIIWTKKPVAQRENKIE